MMSLGSLVLQDVVETGLRAIRRLHDSMEEQQALEQITCVREVCYPASGHRLLNDPLADGVILYGTPQQFLNWLPPTNEKHTR